MDFTITERIFVGIALLLLFAGMILFIITMIVDKKCSIFDPLPDKIDFIATFVSCIGLVIIFVILAIHLFIYICLA